MRYRVYGITLATSASISVPLVASDKAVPDVFFEIVTDPPDATDLDASMPVYTEGMRSDGRPAFEFHVLDDRDAIRIVPALDFHCWPDRIVCHLIDPAHAYLVEVALFGLVLSLWLERRGVVTLHASAVTVGDAVAAFAGRSGGGKTTTAAAMLAAGHRLITEDLLALGEVQGGPIAYPAYPQLRMWPDQLHHLVGRSAVAHAFNPTTDKRRVGIGGDFGRFATSPAPLTRLYVLERAVSPAAPVEITPLSPRHSAAVLVTQSFLPREMVRLGLQGRRLEFFARLLEHVTVCRLTVPDGFDQLPRVVEAVESDLRGRSRA